MSQIPAKTGWLWVKQGFTLFRQQPAELMALFIGYLFIIIMLGFVPVIGQVLPLILTPVFAISFMQACAQMQRGERVSPQLLFVGFRSPGLLQLLLLGLAYLAAILLALRASILFDDGALWTFLFTQQNLDPKKTPDPKILIGLMSALIVYVPAMMAFWYAAPLIFWRKMGVVKAMFYSFIAVKRTAAAFIVYGLGWLNVGIFLPAFVVSLLSLVLGGAALYVSVAISLALTLVMYCSFYPTYTDVFGVPDKENKENKEGSDASNQSDI